MLPRCHAALAGRLVVLILLSASTAPVRAQAPDASREDIVREVTRLDSIWLAAYVTADVEAVRPILADDFVGQIHMTIMDKEAVLARVASSTDVEAMRLDALVVNVYGNVAVAHARRTRVTRSADGPVEARFAYTDVYQYRDGRWVCITGQSAPALDP